MDNVGGEQIETTTHGDEVPGTRLNGPIHLWFSLSYGNYLVIPRALLQSMPVEWQERMVKCLEELKREADAAGVECVSTYRVHPVDGRGRFIPEPVPHYRRAPVLFGSGSR
ncbi:hypothetical protein [Sorangium sp. So ce233]|uniref:hypothetical protein n=1 Tax=Sorangium sp. So ce233 TaxID=3133290 RepID=UPI003F63BF97